MIIIAGCPLSIEVQVNIQNVFQDTQACFNSMARFSQIYPTGLTRSVTYLAGSTVFYKQERRESSPRQSVRAGKQQVSLLESRAQKSQQ